MKKDEILKLRFEKFILKHGLMYDKDALEFIINNFWNYMNEATAPDVLMEVYSELGVYDKENNMYLEHLNKIKENFDIRSNILEIGCGSIPAFGNLVAKEQLKLGKGTITVYDPYLVLDKPKYPNMVLHRNIFTEKKDADNYDLITGIFPCDATELIIKKACENKKDFYIGMCGCSHFKYPEASIYGYNPEAYQNYVISLARHLLEKNNNGELCIDYLNSKYDIEYPILYNKK